MYSSIDTILDQLLFVVGERALIKWPDDDRSFSLLIFSAFFVVSVIIEGFKEDFGSGCGSSTIATALLERILDSPNRWPSKWVVSEVMGHGVMLPKSMNDIHDSTPQQQFNLPW